MLSLPLSFKRELYLACTCVIVTMSCSAQEFLIEPADLAASRPDAAWDAAFLTRMEGVANFKTWNPTKSGANQDDGKGTWSPLMVEVWKKRNDPAAMILEHSGRANTFFRSAGAGSFYKPFSVPGYTGYYFLFKDHPTAPLPQDVLDYARNRATTTTSWNFLSRPDRYYDILYKPSLFNSENFNWMMRLGGVLWAFEVDDRAMGTHPDESGVNRGNTRAFYTNYLNNLTRALFNAGRVEWNSNNYWSHSFTSAMNLYDFAPNPKMKAQAQAIADWMVMEIALHHLDGAFGAADVRAKSNAHLPYAGSIWPHIYAYFVDDDDFPTYPLQSVQDKFYADSLGYLMWSNYRPPQVAIDIAQRKFQLPVEIQSAKPFYYIDNNNYQDWAGDTVKSRRFEFETLYLDDNYLMSSLATYRPDRAASIPTQGGFFTEQSLWRIMAKGSTDGALQIAGNAGPSSWTRIDGRHPREQIGQLTNVMMRIFRTLGSSETLYKLVPAEAVRELDGQTLYVDMGNGVYVAVLAKNTTGVTVTSLNTTHSLYRWTVSANTLASVLVEVGVERDHGSYANFKTAIAANSSNLVYNQVEGSYQYTSTQGRTLKMQYVAPGTILLNPGTWADGPRNWNTAGVPARVWRDGEEVDFSTWDSYRVVEGENIVEQAWGSGRMRAMAGGKGMEIVIDPDTAEVEYFSVTTSETSSEFETWAQALPEGMRAPEAIPFKDGITNLMRYALGGEAAATNLKSHLPKVQQVDGSFSVHYIKRQEYNSLVLQSSNDLQNWDNISPTGGISIQTTPIESPLEEVLVGFPSGHPTPLFFRLKTPD